MRQLALDGDWSLERVILQNERGGHLAFNDPACCYFRYKTQISLFKSRPIAIWILVISLCFAYVAKPGCYFLTKIPRGKGVIDLHRSRGWKKFPCVCVCVCVSTLQVTISISLVPNCTKQLRSRKRLNSKMDYVGSIGTPRRHHH